MNCQLEILMIPSRDLALEMGNERLGNMIVLGAVVQKSGVMALKSLKKALYQVLDLRYHSMIDLNKKALDRGARFVEEKNRVKSKINRDSTWMSLTGSF